jgi:hypothetical protein
VAEVMTATAVYCDTDKDDSREVRVGQHPRSIPLNRSLMTISPDGNIIGSSGDE